MWICRVSLPPEGGMSARTTRPLIPAGRRDARNKSPASNTAQAEALTGIPAGKGWGGRGARAAWPGTGMWPPAFALRGPGCVFGVAAFAPRDRFTQAVRGRASTWRPAGLLECPNPDLFAAFIPVRHTLATGGRRPGLPGPGVSTPRAVRRPHAPVIPQAAGISRARVRAAITGRRFPLDHTPPHVDGPGARRPPPRRDDKQCKGRASYGGQMTLLFV